MNDCITFQITRISNIVHEATTYGAAKLSIKEHQFLKSIAEQSQYHGFTGLSEKQTTWFNAIAKKLEATKGKHQFQVLIERNRVKYQAHTLYCQRAYNAVCFGR